MDNQMTGEAIFRNILAANEAYNDININVGGCKGCKANIRVSLLKDIITEFNKANTGIKPEQEKKNPYAGFVNLFHDLTEGKDVSVRVFIDTDGGIEAGFDINETATRQCILDDNNEC